MPTKLSERAKKDGKSAREPVQPRSNESAKRDKQDQPSVYIDEVDKIYNSPEFKSAIEGINRQFKMATTRNKTVAYKDPTGPAPNSMALSNIAKILANNRRKSP